MWTARALDANPIIPPDMDGRMGRNICTPSLLRMPDWAKGRMGRYHLYFAHHKGTYLRLAWADRLIGPWRLRRAGCLDLAASFFPDTSGLAAAGMPDGPFRYGHIASPQVIADEENRCFHMYYHGMDASGQQATRYARSDDGVEFIAREPLLGPPYIRVTPTPDGLLAAAWGGVLLATHGWGAPFEKVGSLCPGEPVWRHTDIRWRDGGLDVMTTRIGDAPERIFATRAVPRGAEWDVAPLTELLRPEAQWEGAEESVTPSTYGYAPRLAHALRDPVFFTDQGGQEYLVYVGGGERGIGLARLMPNG